MCPHFQDDTDVAVWEHPPSLPRFLRFGIVGIRTYLAGLRRPDFVFYDHVHLAALHATIPSLREIPYGVFLHGIEVWEPLLGRRQEALLGANVLVVNSATTEKLAREVNPWLPKAKVVWLGVPGHDRPADVASSSPIGLIVGRMASAERLKGHDSMMDAWPEIRANVPNAKLVIVGTGDDEKRLRSRATQEKLDGVEFRVISLTKTAIAFTSRAACCSTLPNRKDSDWRPQKPRALVFRCLAWLERSLRNSSRPGLVRFWLEVLPNPISSNL